eukprot:2364289-Pleurochrysis_carterae.AAC.2
MVVGTRTNNHFPAHPGWSLQSDPVKYLQLRYTPNEDVHSHDQATLIARSDYAVNNGVCVSTTQSSVTEMSMFSRSDTGPSSSTFHRCASAAVAEA